MTQAFAIVLAVLCLYQSAQAGGPVLDPGLRKLEFWKELQWFKNGATFTLAQDVVVPAGYRGVIFHAGQAQYYTKTASITEVPLNHGDFCYIFARDSKSYDRTLSMSVVYRLSSGSFNFSGPVFKHPQYGYKALRHYADFRFAPPHSQSMVSLGCVQVDSDKAALHDFNARVGDSPKPMRILVAAMERHFDRYFGGLWALPRKAKPGGGWASYTIEEQKGAKSVVNDTDGAASAPPPKEMVKTPVK